MSPGPSEPSESASLSASSPACPAAPAVTRPRNFRYDLSFRKSASVRLERRRRAPSHTPRPTQVQFLMSSHLILNSLSLAFYHQVFSLNWFGRTLAFFERIKALPSRSDMGIHSHTIRWYNPNGVIAWDYKWHGRRSMI